MALNRTAYQAWDVNSATDVALGLADQLRGTYKGSIWDPANTIVDAQKGFAPAHLFFTDKDLYYSGYQMLNPAYVNRFLDYDFRAPYRGFYKRTEVGLMFPEVVKSSDVPQPGSPIVGKRREPVNIWQDESAPIEDIHYKNYVDFHLFDFAQRFLDASDYSRVKNAVFDSMRKGNAAIEKLWIDTFLANILRIWNYPRGDRLFQFFTNDDNYVPEENYSKVARGFTLKDKEVRKSLNEFGKYVRQYYVNRIPYLTNLNGHEVMGQGLDKKISKGDKILVDRSDANKAIKYLRGVFMDKDNQSKSNTVGYQYRRQSIDAFSSMIFRVLDRMMTDNYFNWCGHQYGKDNKDVQAYDLRCRPENLVVFLNNEDLTDIRRVLGSQYAGPFTEQRVISTVLERYENMGISFYGLPWIVPGMAIVLDTICFRLIEYFNESYSQFFPFDLIDATVHHMYKKPVLYRYTACQVIELGEGQKYAVPIGGGSENLPLLVEE